MITFTVLLAFYVVMARSEILAIEPPEGNKQSPTTIQQQQTESFLLAVNEGAIACLGWHCLSTNEPSQVNLLYEASY